MSIIFKACGFIMHAKAHFSGFAGHSDLIHHFNEVGVGAIIKNNKTCIYS